MALSQKQLQEIAAASLLATSKVFLGGNASRIVLNTIEGKRSKLVPTGIKGANGRRGLAGLGEKTTITPEMMTGPPMAKIGDTGIEAVDGRLTPAIIAEYDQLEMQYAMSGNVPPWNYPFSSNYKAGDSSWPLILTLYFAGNQIPGGTAGAGADMAFRVGMLSKPSISKDEINRVVREVNRVAQERRGTPGGIVGKLVNSTIVPVARVVEENPALLFVAPVATAMIAGAASGAGVFSAFTGGGSAAGTAAAAAPAATTAATAAPAAAAAAPTAATLAPVALPASAVPIATGGALTTATTAATAAAAIPKLAPIIDKAKEIAPKVVEGVNTARTVAAVANGDVPPPPIDIGDGSLTDWASAIAEQYITGKLSDAERERLTREIQTLQNQAAANAPASVPYTPAAQVPGQIQAAMAEKKDDNLLLVLLAAGIPLAALLLQG